MTQGFKKVIEQPHGLPITLETGRLARQAHGAVVLQVGKMMILATAVSAEDARENIDFFPLSVDYQEKYAGAGRIPGGFPKRENRLSEYEILISRLVDRVVRPLFPDDYFAETQLNIQLISADPEVLPDAYVALAASTALTVSDIPFTTPISEVRVIKVEEDYIVNPTPAQLEKAELDLMVGASYDNIMMVEGEAKEVSEAELMQAMQTAHDAIRTHCTAQKELEAEAGKTEKREYSHITHDDELKTYLMDTYYQRFYDVAKSNQDKKARGKGFKEIKNDYFDNLPEDTDINLFLAGLYLKSVMKKACRDLVLNEGTRLDGRETTEVRPIWSEVNYLPGAHGSAIFTRGETQSLATTTLGTKLDEKMIDGVMHVGYDTFLLHYNFPAFSTGEVKPNRAPSRREIGHGNLAHRALKSVIPNHDDLPYTIRITSDILESNGSSSMATVCAGTLALMDAGIPISKPVSGIAMGLISDPESGKSVVLSDILGDEDHLGDMDFKVTGTEDGITACQMDIKIDGLPYELLDKALNQAKEGRLHILSKMKETLAEPRPDFKESAPRIESLKIDKEMIGAVIGPGGKVVQEIQKVSEATIVIEESDTHGLVNIFANSKVKLDKALTMVKNIIAVPEINKIYTGRVVSIMDFGAFIEFMPGKEGLLHISEVKWERVETLRGLIEEGEEIQVKLLDVDKKTGKYRLSRKVLLPKPEGYVERPPRQHHRRDNRGGRRDRRR